MPISRPAPASARLTPGIGRVGRPHGLRGELRRPVSAAVFVDKILKGVKPGDIPIEQPARFKSAVNLKTAKALGLEIPATLLATADEVIE